MLMVNGLDTVIVARWDLQSLPFFTVAVALSTFVSGILQSLTNPIIPVAAALGAEGKADELEALLIRGSRVMAAASIVTTAPLIFAGGVLLSWWVGPAYAVYGTSLLAGLAAASFIRNSMLTYVVVSQWNRYASAHVGNAIDRGLGLRRRSGRPRSPFWRGRGRRGQDRGGLRRRRIADYAERASHCNRTAYPMAVAN